VEKKIAILGSTGSIGRQTLQVIDNLGAGYRVVALTAGGNAGLLADQVRRYAPELAVLSDLTAADALARSLQGVACRVEAGLPGQVSAACHPAVDIVVAALVGFSGFIPVLKALQCGKTVALANKEALVVGGELLQRQGLLDRERIYPVDSEHSAIWQCIGAAPVSQVRRIWLTASGGPFRDWEAAKLPGVTPEQALAHPNWRMGAKITVDSATMMNKGFEALEARWLFGLNLDQIRVVVHPQSAVHSMVEFIDGAMIAQISPPDMRLPIQYALTYPERRESVLPGFDLYGQCWSFGEPDRERFPCLDYAYQAGEIGGTMPACLNAANEVAVEQFLKGNLSFTGIPRVVGAVMAEHKAVNQPELADILEADRWARAKAFCLINDQ
jgi:1-deoxy-D-xylulose-5-phosphate reductoisomerase